MQTFVGGQQSSYEYSLFNIEIWYGLQLFKLNSTSVIYSIKKIDMAGKKWVH
jgi:hypothetical protein